MVGIDDVLRFAVQVEQWDPAFAQFIKGLKAKKEVVITGDLNCAHQAIDLHSPRTNLKTPGYTPVRFFRELSL